MDLATFQYVGLNGAKSLVRKKSEHCKGYKKYPLRLFFANERMLTVTVSVPPWGRAI